MEKNVSKTSSINSIVEDVLNNLTIFNRLTNKINYLSVTMSGSVKDIRNRGKWADWAREIYGRYDDPSVEWAIDVLNNFSLVDIIYWKKEAATSQYMRALLFKRR